MPPMDDINDVRSPQAASMGHPHLAMGAITRNDDRTNFLLTQGHPLSR